MDEMSENISGVHEDNVRKYQLSRAISYVQEHKSTNGSEDTLEVNIISDLLRIIRSDANKMLKLL